jgi:hypothetical protein
VGDVAGAAPSGPDGLGDIVHSTGGDLLTSLPSFVATPGGVGRDAAELVGSALPPALDAAGGAVQLAADVVTVAVHDAGQVVWSAVVPVADAVTGAVHEAGAVVWSTVVPVAGAVTGVVHEAGAVVWSAVVPVADAVTSAVHEAGTVVWSAVAPVADAVSGPVHDAVNVIGGPVVDAIAPVASAALDGVSAAAPLVTDAANAVVSTPVAEALFETAQGVAYDLASAHGVAGAVDVAMHLSPSTDAGAIAQGADAIANGAPVLLEVLAAPPGAAGTAASTAVALTLAAGAAGRIARSAACADAQILFTNVHLAPCLVRDAIERPVSALASNLQALIGHRAPPAELVGPPATPALPAAEHAGSLGAPPADPPPVTEPVADVPPYREEAVSGLQGGAEGGNDAVQSQGLVESDDDGTQRLVGKIALGVTAVMLYVTETARRIRRERYDAW